MVAASREEKVAARDAQSEGQFVSPFARGFRIALDASVAKSDDGRVLVGGSRLKALRLEGREVDEIARLTQGEPALVTESNERLVRVLLDLEMAWPVPSGGSLGIGDVTVVVPVRDHSRHVERLLGAPGVFAGVAGIVLVDDGSQDGEARALEEICSSAAGIEVTLLRCDTSVGPAEARNLGAKRAVTEVLVFVDADCRPEPGWLEPLLAHFDDEVVGAVAPRLRAVRTSLNRSSEDETSSARGLRALAQESFLAYELEMGPLDRGVRPSSVGPGKRISFVATAALAVRRSAWQEVGGFDPALRFGEDIDFSWRVCNHGWSIRYEPSSVLGHEIRDDLFGMLLQRYQYGTPAAVLASRYPDAFRTIEVEPSSALSFVLACAGHGLAGSAVVGASAVVSARRLTRIGIGWTDAVRKVGREQVRDGINLMWTMRRDFWPLTLLLAVLSRRFRRIAFGAAVLGPLLEWVRRRPALSPARWLVLSLGDGLAHGAGVWRSCLRARSFEALVPAWRSIPSEASTVADRDPNRSICRP